MSNINEINLKHFKKVSGNLKDIYDKNPKMEVKINAVT